MNYYKDGSSTYCMVRAFFYVSDTQIHFNQNRAWGGTVTGNNSLIPIKIAGLK